MLPLDVRPSRPPARAEQEVWRDQCMYGANAYIEALETAEAIGSIGENLAIGTLRSFMSSVFKTRLMDVEGEEHAYRVDVRRPDGKVRRAIIRSGGYGGLMFEATRFSDVLPDGSEENVREQSGVSFLHLTTGITH